MKLLAACGVIIIETISTTIGEQNMTMTIIRQTASAVALIGFILIAASVVLFV